MSNSSYFSVCLWCKHLDAKHFDDKVGWFCAAFPDGIPSTIHQDGLPIHLAPYPGDHGFQFERQVDETLLPGFFRNYLQNISEFESTVLLQMMIDWRTDPLNWRYDPEKYPMKSDKPE